MKQETQEKEHVQDKELPVERPMETAAESRGETTTTVEINFRLDSHGRTTGDDNNDNVKMNYDTQTVHGHFILQDGDTETSPTSPATTVAADDDLLLDCEIADSALLPRTFWLPHNSPPRCRLEQLATDIYRHHGGDCCNGGAEWWVQIRPSPPAGRYRVLEKQQNNGICFHWDKDEDLRLACGAFIHPHVSTVTYLTDVGAPTVTVNRRCHPITGEWLTNEDNDSVFVSWPAQGKHLSFDGRHLHAAPVELVSYSTTTEELDRHEETSKSFRPQQRRQRRVTFLVHIWQYHQPFNVHPFPETMLSKMSGYKVEKESRPLFWLPPPHDQGQRNLIRLRITSGKQSASTNNSNSPKDCVVTERSLDDCELLTWPMGGAEDGETIRMRLPLTDIRAARGQSLAFTYDSLEGVMLIKNHDRGEEDSTGDNQATKRSKPC